MKTTFGTAAFVLACSAATAIQAAPAPAPEVLSTETLRSFCSAKDANLRRLCSFYILGVVQGLAIGASRETNPQAKCVRDSLPAADMVKAFMELSGALKVAYPSDMQAPAVSIVTATVARKFPCDDQAPAKAQR